MHSLSRTVASEQVKRQQDRACISLAQQTTKTHTPASQESNALFIAFSLPPSIEYLHAS
jgi:hypothetical protein